MQESKVLNFSPLVFFTGGKEEVGGRVSLFIYFDNLGVHIAILHICAECSLTTVTSINIV